MDSSNQPTPNNSTPKPLAWIILVIAVLGVGGYFLFATGQEDKNTNNVNSVAVTNTAVNDNMNEAANANTALNTNEAINTSTKIDTSDWLTYTNDMYGYTIKYPKEATASEADLSTFVTSEDFTQYSGKLCIFIDYQNIGSVVVIAPENNEQQHAICGRTGVGLLREDIEKSGKITVDGKEYDLTGNEFILEPTSEELAETLEFHQETLTLKLDDQTTFQIGTAARSTNPFSEYLAIRDILIQIVGSYKQI